MVRWQFRVQDLWGLLQKFFLCGRLIFGPDVRSLVMTIFLIVAPIAIFCVFVARHLLHKFSGYNDGYAILAMTIVYTFYRNYRFFFMFVSSSTLLCIYVFALSALYIKFIMDGEKCTIWEAMRRSAASVALMVYTFIAVWFVGGLTLFHLYLISTNQTTYENFHYRCDNKVNPYNEGVINNFSVPLCTKIEPSKNNFHAKVQQDALGQMVVITQSTARQDVVEDLPTKVGTDLEAGRKAVQRDEHNPEREVNEEVQIQNSNGHESGLETKEGYEDAFTRAIGQPLSFEVSDTISGSHPRCSSWGRKNGSLEITPDMHFGTKTLQGSQ